MTSFRPDNFMLLPTMACQAACSYCFARKTGAVMDRETALSALDFIARLAPSGRDFHLTFHGGEPLLAGEDFYRWILPEIISRFGRRVHLAIQSNLWAMTDCLAELFARYRVSVGTSLDGPEDMCDNQRGKGYYEKTRAGMAVLHKHGIAAGPICTFASRNAHRAAEVFQKSDRPYAIHGAVPTLGASPDPDDDPGGALSVDQMTKILLDSYEAYRTDPAHNRITTIDALVKGCYDGKGSTCTFFDCLGTFAAIDPQGDVYACQRFCGMKEYVLGNVRDGLTERKILESPAFALLAAAEEQKKEACADCPHWDYCAGGCLYSALAEAATDKTGADLIRPHRDPYCEAYRAAFDRISHDMALEMGSVMLGRDEPTPILAMAGDGTHPYDLRRSRELMRLSLEKGRTSDGFGERLRSRFPEMELNKLYLHVTFACPLRCPHCYAEGGEAACEELAPRQFASIVRDACDRLFHSVVLTGGEPLVYSGFDELCERLSSIDRKGTKLILRTSLAFPVPEERLRMICGLFDEIVVSLDGDRETHDARRGRGRYDQTVENLRTAISFAGPGRFSLAATMTRSEAESPVGESVRELAGKLHIDKVRFRPVLPLGRADSLGRADPLGQAEGTRHEPWQLCSEELVLDEHFRPRHTCGLGQNLYVKPDGTAYPCYAWCAPDKILGDLSRESLGDLLDQGKLYEYCCHDVDSNEKCRSCEVRYLCGGICKAWVPNKENIDCGDFDCSDRLAYYRRVAEKLKEN
ncbi:MAG: SPASM domain-containing protein [Firmicutes bacterium]|nr:SPASM domain-containing protein [Bacillota bacterium]